MAMSVVRFSILEHYKLLTVVVLAKTSLITTVNLSRRFGFLILFVGEQGSQLFQVSEKNCTSPQCDRRSGAFCACDSLGRGEYECGCQSGYYAYSKPNSNYDQCAGKND